VGADAQGKAGAAQTTWLAASDLFDWPEVHVQHADRHSCELPVALLRERGWTRGLGVEMDNYYILLFLATPYRVLEEAFGRDEIADATGLVNWRRAVKSPTE